MIYWINGSYGVGKSTIADCLKRRLGKAHIFDAEEVGNAVRDNYPKECRESVIFEGYELWREMNYLLLRDISEKFQGDVIVPMTLVLDESCHDILCRLQADGFQVEHIILDADWQTIHDRILSRGEDEDCWCMANIQMCLDVHCKWLDALHINTADRTPEQIVNEILSGSRARKCP